MADDQPLPDLMGYATPNELAMQRLYARALLGRTQDINDNSPAVSPFAILGGVVNQMAGQRMLGEAAQQDRMRQVGSVAGAPVAGGEDDNTPAFGGGPLSARPPTGNVSDGGPLSQAPYSKVTSAQEGSGSYTQLSPVVKSPETGQPDRAYGKYQVMGNNIPQWTKEVLGTPLTPAQFLSNPQAQEAVYKTKFGQLVQQYGPGGAAKAWYAGPNGMTNPGAQAHTMDGTPLGPTVAQYGQNFTKLASTAPGLPTGALPSNGAAPPPQAAGSSQVPAGPTGGMLMAQAPGSPQMAANSGRGAPVVGTQAGPVAAQGGQPIGPVPLIPRVSRKQYLTGQMLGSPENQALWSSMYYGQNQPIQAQGFGGHWVMDPRGQQPPRFIPDQQKIPLKAGEVSADIPWNYNERGEAVLPPGLGGLIPGVGGGPLSAPPPTSGGAAPSSSVAPSQEAPPAPSPAAPGPQGALQSAMPKLAALETGTMNDAGPLGANPPPSATGAVPVPPIEKPVAAAETAPAGERTAQSGSMLGNLMDLGLNYKGREAMTGEVGKAAAEYLGKTRQQAYDALNDEKNLNLLGQVMNDPSYNPGIIGGGIGLLKKRLESSIAQTWPDLAKEFGLDPKSSSASEVANKLTNELNLGSLRQKLGGLGQVRIFEGEMVKSAFANMDNSLAANKAVLALAQAVNKRVQDVQKYVQSLPGHSQDVDIQDKVYDHFHDLPIMSPEQEKFFQEQIESDTKEKKAAPSGPLTTPPPGAGGVLPPGLRLKGR
jgi:hypothetical protein